MVRENTTVSDARKEVVGLSEDAVRMCAGFPSATATTSEGGSIWTYRREMPRANLNVAAPVTLFGSLPAINSSASVSSGGNCTTQYRFLDSKVTEVEFAGDNNTYNEINGLCASMVDSCLMYARRNEKK